MVHEIGLHDSIMAGDTKIVINFLRRGDMFHFAFGHLVKDTMSHVNPLRSFVSLMLTSKATLLQIF